METAMIILFGIGVVYAALTAIVGDLFGLEFHAGELPFLSPTIIATFMTVFGGIGYLLQHHTNWSVIPVTSLALLIALGVSSAILFLVVLPLQAAQKGTAHSSKEMIGLEAKVVISIEALRLGEIVYEQGGTRHNAPAKALEEETIPQGSQVRILDETAGTFVVEKI
ncbi:hypothetical protein [Cohnella luojiensis]|uniref:Membrane protein NfeD2 N-terminal transmembrane domain-containing protein n=1 Tax=Cohnella luojiensis TaxID=652876 RepID=A0A4Y8M6R3_9BACL|nr:hypothetical protein [Cohnella luojiensis]TFE30641.1 hypothetical protein E2980_02325 [Cohnella luojiensis]